MALEITKQAVEFEACVGSGTAQTLARAETLVPGAGREAIEVLISDALVSIERVEAQTDRIVVEGAVRCQATYRQGDEPTLRALSAQTQISQVFDMAGAAPGMTARACACVEHVEARYENGHMVFLVSVSISARAYRLSPTDVVTGISGECGTEISEAQICSTRITSETEAMANVREEITLPAALDARTALMEWGEPWIESCAADLGGVRVKGRVNMEALISSGVEGRPVAAVKHPIDFDCLVEVPEWLAGDVCAAAVLRRLESRVEQGGEKEDSVLVAEAEVGVTVTSIGRDCVSVVADAYSTAENRLDITGEETVFCKETACSRMTEQIKGTLLLSENAPGVGNVISVAVHPNISGWGTNSESVIEGVLEATVLYMPGGSDVPASARSEMPFSVKYPGELNDGSMVCVSVLNAEASTLMSDRVELKCMLGVDVFSREEGEAFVITDVSEGELLQKKPGVILCWPSGEDTLWSVGRRYSVPVSEIKRMNGGSDAVTPNKALMIRI